MSGTDNTRPLRLQWDDPTVKAQVRHNHVSRHVYWAKDGTPGDYSVLHECDYEPSNNTIAYRAKKHLPRYTGLPVRCHRVTWAYGGKNSAGRQARQERKFRRRNLRQRERAALDHIRRLNYRKVLKDCEDFDVLPRREDARTIQACLS